MNAAPAPEKFLDLDGARMHYRDVGAGPAVVCLHGNPTWSYYYRKLVDGLRDRFRLIVPDHVGCGYSDKPADDAYEYRLARRVRDVETLVERVLGREPFSLVVHDWGGMIGLAAAVRRPEQVERLVVLNTACGGLPATARMPFSLTLARLPVLGAILVRGHNAFVRGAIHFGACTPLAKEVRRQYLAPYGSWKDRIAVHRFVQDIPLRDGHPSMPVVREVEEKLSLLREKPMLVCWGERDFVFDRHFLAQWERSFPAARVHRFQNAGHFVLEDAAEEIVPLVREFLAQDR